MERHHTKEGTEKDVAEDNFHHNFFLLSGRIGGYFLCKG